MTVTIALAGDTMLGRGVAQRLEDTSDPAELFDEGVRDVLAGADLVLLNLECCISTRGSRWDPVGKPFHFRAPPHAAGMLARLGVDCVTLANNHALDYGYEALLDTRDHLAAAGVLSVGAGVDLAQARRAAVLEASGLRVGVLGVTDHPDEFAATDDRPGVNYVPLELGVPEWLAKSVAELRDVADVAIVTPHWGPNMTARPVPHVRQAAKALLECGASLVAGHSAHVFHGVEGPVLYDMGDFVDDYIVDPDLRNDLGLIFLVTLDEQGPVRLRAVPIALDFCYTRLATGREAEWIRRRFAGACAEFGTQVSEELTVSLR
ncbi:CapA family protein [Thermoactinospora rubra]|uniref:CapA family protein n=1 Tax=Thermoactinospora rubra TaxID=1088767 RepID=UPI000A0FCE6C|nr:CapA family protein [Thermoactinospora rubra]